MENKVLRFQMVRKVYHYEDYELEMTDEVSKEISEVVLQDPSISEYDLVDYIMENDHLGDAVKRVGRLKCEDELIWNPGHGDKYDNTTEFIGSFVD